jgi:hypothetical protein
VSRPPGSKQPIKPPEFDELYQLCQAGLAQLVNGTQKEISTAEAMVGSSKIRGIRPATFPSVDSISRHGKATFRRGRASLTKRALNIV